MKVCLLALLFSLPASADPAIPTTAAGTYSFQGDFKVVQKLRYKLVYAFTEQGAKELTRREAAGEECSNKGSDTYQCKKFASLNGAAGEVRSRVDSAISGQSLVLGEMVGEPSLISKGDDSAEYSVNQSATFLGKTYDHYRLESTLAGWSIRLGDETDAQFNLSASGELALTRLMPVSTSREVLSTYLVEANFRRM